MPEDGYDGNSTDSLDPSVPDELRLVSRVLKDFERGILSLRPLLFIGLASVEDYPNNLPTKIRKAFERTGSPKLEWHDYKGGSVAILAEPKNEDEAINVAFTELYIVHQKKEERSAALSRIVLEQSLVANFALFDVFLADLLRLIARKQPRILMSDEKIARRVVVEAGSWDRLLDALIEDYVYQFGMSSLTKRFTFLRTKLGLNHGLEDNDLGFVVGAETVRNVLMHAGGMVTEKFLKITNLLGLKAGERVPLDIGHSFRTGGIMLNAAYAITEATCRKHFKATEAHLSAVGVTSRLPYDRIQRKATRSSPKKPRGRANE